MKYALEIGDKKAVIDLSENMTTEELKIVKTTLAQMIEVRIEKLRIQNQNALTPADSIDSLYPPLSGRTRNVLKRGGCETIGDVLNKTPTELELIRNMGKHSLEEVTQRFHKYGLFRGEAVELSEESEA